MLSPRSDDSPGKLNSAAPEPAAAPRAAARPLLSRPLVPVTLALMTGIAATAWGLHLSQSVVLAGVLVLWSSLAFLWWGRLPARILPLLLVGLLGVAFAQQAWQPAYSPENIFNLPLNQNLTVMGHLNRPGKLGEDRVQLFMQVQAWRSPWGWRPASGNLLVAAPGLERPPVGTGLVVTGRISTPRMLLNPGTFNRPRYLAADGLFREIRLRDPQHLIFLASTAAYPLGERLQRRHPGAVAGAFPRLPGHLSGHAPRGPGRNHSGHAPEFCPHRHQPPAGHQRPALGHGGRGHLFSLFLAAAALLLAALEDQRGQGRHPGRGPPGGLLCLGGGRLAFHPAGRSHGAGLPASGLFGAARRGVERPGPGGPDHPEPVAVAPLWHLVSAFLCGGGRPDLPGSPPGQRSGRGGPSQAGCVPAALSGQRVAGGVGGGGPGHRAPGGRLFPGSLPPGHSGQPGGHPPGPALRPAAWGRPRCSPRRFI